MPTQPRIAIIGAGLCGLTLAIALHKRGIPYTIYESRGSLTETGAGINLGPNATQAFELINPELAKEARGLATRNPGEARDVWLSIRVAKGTGGEEGFEDGEALVEAKAVGTGNMFFRRDDLLLLLARMAGADEKGRIEFNKRVVGLEQPQSDGSKIEMEGPVTLTFADSTIATADLVVGTDGIHSAVRSCLFPLDPAVSRPQYSDTGGYRAIIPMPIWLSSPILASTLGARSNIILGRNTYTIMYPVDNGRVMNVGLWTYRYEDPPSSSWVLKSQSQEMDRDFSDHGSVMAEILRLVHSANAMGKRPQPDEVGDYDDVDFWKSYYHAQQPASCFDRRICMIGDAAHSMPPHLGAGAGQAMEDAYVLAEVLDELLASSPPSLTLGGSSSLGDADVEAAMKAYEAVRRPRYQKILDESAGAMEMWTTFWLPELRRDGEEGQTLRRTVRERTEFIWKVDLASMARHARELLRKEF
ncbi:FAD/NAD(P)-binding domain-containing protein [Polychaeton citri CBS 116435]|uniref:FAD/NAD(P)-binding domain-containing protein n=1 Tax=Polychaeton citri CBS 116435 TaxID=1314669 RepID=A0A9P4Q2X4_9PEZI|nr:FAD/NAD(P)-binding domain-containing protein [Polychaeton citri CBS 116435]